MSAIDYLGIVSAIIAAGCIAGLRPSVSNARIRQIVREEMSYQLVRSQPMTGSSLRRRAEEINRGEDRAGA